MPDEIGHLAARDPRRHLDDPHRAVVRDDQLREGDPVAQAERVHRVHRDPLCLGEHVRVDRGGVDVDPADAEADPGRPQPVGERQRERLAAARDHDPVQLEPVVEALDDRLVGRRLGERGVHVPVELVLRLDVEDPALAAGVGGLQHRRDADGVERRPRALHVARAGEARLRHARVGERAPHRDLVRHQVRRLGADPRQPERLGDRRHDRHGAIGGDREDAVDGMAPPDLGDRGDVREVDGLADVRDLQPERVRVAVDGDDAEAELLGPQDRAALVAPGADEEDRLHVARDRIRCGSRSPSGRPARSGPSGRTRTGSRA